MKVKKKNRQHFFSSLVFCTQHSDFSPFVAIAFVLPRADLISRYRCCFPRLTCYSSPLSALVTSVAGTEETTCCSLALRVVLPSLLLAGRLGAGEAGEKRERGRDMDENYVSATRAGRNLV